MRKLVASEWISLDGVFDAGTMDQWFNPYQSEERDEVIKEVVDTADAFLLGRVTYEMLAPYWSKLENNEFGIADRLNSAPKYVVSSALERADWNNSTIIKDNVEEEVTRLKQQPGQNIVIYGSATLVQSLMQAGLIDEFRFLVHPILATTGKRFVQDGMGTTKLKLVESKPLSLGVLLVRYQPEKD